MPKSRTQLAAIRAPTADVAREAGHAPQSPLKAIRAKPGNRAGNFAARRYLGAVADCISTNSFSQKGSRP